MARRKRPAVDPQETAALEVLLAQVKTPAQLEGVFQRLKQRMVEQVLQAELTAPGPLSRPRSKHHALSTRNSELIPEPRHEPALHRLRQRHVPHQHPRQQEPVPGGQRHEPQRPRHR